MTETIEEAFEGLTEDKVPRGISLAVFLAAFAYALAAKVCAFGPFAALGANPVTWSRFAARAMFAGIGGLARNRGIPSGLFKLINTFGATIGSVGKGSLKGTLDGLRRETLQQLTQWSKITDETARRAAMQPSLGVAEGLIEANWSKMTGKVSGASTGGDNKKRDEKGASPGGLNGMGPKTNQTLHEHLTELAKTDAPAARAVQDAVDDFVRRNPKLGPFILEANMRRLEGVGPDEIVRATQEPTGVQIMDDPEGGAAKVCQREFALKRLALDARRLALEARKADGTGPKQADPAKDGRPEGAVGPKEFDLGPFGRVANPMWEADQPHTGTAPSASIGRATAHALRREEWRRKNPISASRAPAGPPSPRPPRPPRNPPAWLVNARSAVGTWFASMLWPPTIGRIIALLVSIVVVIVLIIVAIAWLVD